MILRVFIKLILKYNKKKTTKQFKSFSYFFFATYSISLNVMLLDLYL